METKHILWITFCAIALIGMTAMAGCSSQPQAPAAPPAPVQQESNPAPQTQETQSPTPSEKPVAKPFPDELQKALAKNANIKNYQYIQKKGGDSTTLTVMGDRIKISYQTVKRYSNFDYFDVYVNTNLKTAYLVCPDAVQCKGKKGMAVAYAQFKTFETPMEALGHITEPTVTEHTQIDGKTTLVISFVNTLGNTERQWIWDWRGIPLRDEQVVNGVRETVNYDKMIINEFVEADVEVPTDIEMI